MKEAKLKQLLAKAKKAHKQSSSALKEIAQKSSHAKKALKKRKGTLEAARKEYKLSRKTYRELNRMSKELRLQHLQNHTELKRLSKKWAKLEKAAIEKKIEKQG